ncbi:MAG: DUF5683 domain-containing protein [Panacibacter sp.]
MRSITIIISVICMLSAVGLRAQNSKQKLANISVIDTSIKKTVTDSAAKKIITDTTAVKDTVVKKKHDPNKATLRSAVLPGWGQAYNREYWKIPIVAGALAVPAATFVYNNKWYKKTRDAYNIVINNDTANFSKIDKKLIIPDTGYPLDASRLQYYRNQFRRDKDYSVLYFLIVWGLNVVDATVFGHLKDFDVSDDLSMNVQPNYNPLTKTLGVGLALNFKTPQRKSLVAF